MFSRTHKQFYATCLLDLHERLFSGSPSFPAPAEVVHAIYDVMRAHPDLWSEGNDFGEGLPQMISTGRRRMRRADVDPVLEPADRELSIAKSFAARRHWLEEGECGLRITVDMPMESLLVIERFASLNRDVSRRFGGSVVQIRLGLEAVATLTPQITDRARRESALALRAARQQADQFTKNLRAILADLKRIRRAAMESTSFGARLEAFFEEFVEQLLLKDFASILTFNHPYRFRDEIRSGAPDRRHAGHHAGNRRGISLFWNFDRL